MRKGQPQTEEAKQKLREARALQVHPSLVAHGITQEQIDEAVRNRKRWCCGDCKDFRPIGEFSAKAPRCRVCNAAKRERWRKRVPAERLLQDDTIIRKWREENPEYSRRRDWMRKYGVTPEWYDETLRQQDGHCALCPATTAHKTGNLMLFVDHCHTSGAVRGLLCAKCNTHLGLVEADQGWHDRALDYLTRKFPEVS